MRAHYIVRYSKRKLVPGRSLTFTRGEEVPASVNEVKVYDEQEADAIARDHRRYDGDLTTITKVSRNGRKEEISNGWNGTGSVSPEERQRLDISDVLDFVQALADGARFDSLESAARTARYLVGKHNGSCLGKGA